MTHQGRTRCAKRINDRLSDRLERMSTNRPARTATKYKVPTLDGRGYVEYIILQYTKVNTADNWGGDATPLHFWEALNEEVHVCGRATTVPGVRGTTTGQIRHFTKRSTEKVQHL